MSNRDATDSPTSSRSSSEPSEDHPSATKSDSGKDKKPAKGAKPRLTASQKSFNHKDAENKRRTAIRERFTELSQMVPGALGLERSEQVMLGKAADFLKDMLKEQRRLEAIAADQGIRLDKGAQMRDDDLGGPNWKSKNMDQYEASKLKKPAGGGRSVSQGDEDND